MYKCTADNGSNVIKILQTKKWNIEKTEANNEIDYFEETENNDTDLVEDNEEDSSNTSVMRNSYSPISV